VSSSHPVPDSERNLSGLDLFLLWAGAAVALPEIWTGSLIVGLGLAAGFAAIVAGHAIGALPMAGAAWMGARHGVPAIVSTRGALGYRGAWIAGVLNVIQMIGWTGFMVWVAGNAAAGLPVLSSVGPKDWMVAIGALTTFWALAGNRWWKLLERMAMLLLLGLSVLMTIQVFRAYDAGTLLRLPRDPSLGFLRGLDAVVVMPVSWLPLVADYTRYARSARGAAIGTSGGYFLCSSWMYAVGLVAALATGSGSPDSIVIQLLADTGWAGAGLLIVLFSTFTTTFLNVFSNAISAQSLLPRLPARPLVLAGGVIGTLLALRVDATTYEPFLLFIGSAFCPLFGVVLTDYFLVRRGRYEGDALFRFEAHQFTGGFHVPGLVAWAAGFGLYQAAARGQWAIGATLPAMALAAAIYMALAWRRGGGTR